MKSFNKIKKITKLIKLTLFALLLFSLCTPGSVVYAENNYESWVRSSQSYNDGDLVIRESSKSDGEKQASKDGKAHDDHPSPTTKEASGLLAQIGTAISDGLSNAVGIDTSMTGIIMGRAANKSGAFVFDLMDDNWYGIVGATIYVVLRPIFMIILFVTTLYQVIAIMWKGDSRGGAIIKQALLTFTINIAILYLMPLVVDWACVVRDKLGVVLFKGVRALSSTGLSEIGDIEDEFYSIYQTTPNFVNAILYLAACLLPIVYALDYIKIAVFQTILFGLYPIFNFMSALDQGKSRSQWCISFFTNCFVPSIDIAMLFLPSMIIKFLDADGVSMQGNPFLKLLMVFSIYICIRPVRDRILSMLGNKFGIAGGRTLGSYLGAVGKKALGGLMAAGSALKNYHKSKDKQGEKDAAEADKLDDPMDSGKDMSEVPQKDIPSEKEAGGDDKDSKASGGEDGDDKSNGEKENAPQEPTAELKNDGDSSETKAEAGAQESEISASDEKSENSSQNLIDDLSVSKESLKEQASSDKESMAHEVAENSYKADGIDHEDFNMGRLANLQSMDNMREKAADLDKESAELNRENSRLNTSVHKDEKALSELKKQGYKQEDGKWVDSNGNYSVEANKIQEGIDDKKATITANKDKIAENSADKQILHGEIARREDNERAYAAQYGNTGRTGETFKSAEDFNKQLKHESQARTVANFQNYKDKKFDGVLSTQQRMQFERKAAKRELMSQVAKVGVGTAAAVAMSPVAIAAAAGGEGEFSSTAHGISSFAGTVANTTAPYIASASASIGGKAVGGVKNTIKATPTAVGTVVGMASNPRRTVQRAANTVAKATDNVVSGVGNTKKVIKQSFADNTAKAVGVGKNIKAQFSDAYRNNKYGSNAYVNGDNSSRVELEQVVSSGQIVSERKQADSNLKTKKGNGHVNPDTSDIDISKKYKKNMEVSNSNYNAPR